MYTNTCKILHSLKSLSRWHGLHHTTKQPTSKGAITSAAHRHNVNCEVFLHLYLVFYYNFSTVIIVTVGMLNRGRLKTRDLTSRDHRNCGGWHRETGQLGTISQEWTSRDLTRNVTLWRFDNTIREFWVYFHFACAESLFRDAGQKSDLAIRFGDHNFLLQGNKSSVGIHFRYILAISLVRKRRNSVNSASGLKTVIIIVFSCHDFLYRG